MDRPYLRHQILKHKNLIHNLHKNSKVSQSLNNANNEGLNLVLKLLHLITQGRIKLPQSATETISKSLRSKKLSEFESRRYLNDLLSKPREDKLRVIKQFNKLYSTLFHYIMKPPKNMT